jgi:hypothetical protein
MVKEYEYLKNYYAECIKGLCKSELRKITFQSGNGFHLIEQCPICGRYPKGNNIYVSQYGINTDDIPERDQTLIEDFENFNRMVLLW